MGVTKTTPSLLEDFHASIQKKDLNKAAELDDQIQEQELNQIEARKIYLLNKAEFQLYQQNISRAKNTISYIEERVEDSDQYSHYRIKFLKGLQKYFEKDYHEALYFLKLAKNNMNKISPLELAAYYYRIAKVYYKLDKIVLSIQCVQMAYQIYEQNTEYKMMANCYIQLASSYQEIKRYTDAERYYRLALEVGSKVNYQQLNMKIYLNIGFLYSEQDKPEVAVRYLQQALESSDSENSNFHTEIYFLLTKQLYMLDRIDEGNKWYNSGMDLCKQTNNQEYYCHFRGLKAIYSPDHKKLYDFESEFINIVDYFMEKKLWYSVREYSELLATYYQDVEQYEQACEYYDLMLFARDNLH
ncbi:tetratricopeptide repeat protein [Lentibacillus cibarius]|uniref:Tetratricopeptide repeat protein n=1 Tax=Lentibacillus cibarius TaxID=2583219 RepID=A0A5S3QLB3_9BACI|nr:tetratricopeptide repeat protein [Lentibacillus cibarius]TMN22722.1 tetratricopeptide repeat protein [Lentibacillus cibarius]